MLFVIGVSIVGFNCFLVGMPTSWQCLGEILGAFGGVRESLGRLLERLGSLLGGVPAAFCAALGGCWGVLRLVGRVWESCWTPSAAFWGRLGTSRGRPAGVLDLLGGY